MALADKKCEPCHGGTPALSRNEFEPLLRELKDWQVVDDHKLHKSVKTKDFKQALDLANKVGAIAEEEGHHPDLLVRWGELGIDMWTHAVDGLSQADFVMAAKIDRAI
jgi:4a-hydroxytetrahydrobiopterin dehydratase